MLNKNPKTYSFQVNYICDAMGSLISGDRSLQEQVNVKKILMLHKIFKERLKLIETFRL